MRRHPTNVLGLPVKLRCTRYRAVPRRISRAQARPINLRSAHSPGYRHAMLWSRLGWPVIVTDTADRYRAGTCGLYRSRSRLHTGRRSSRLSKTDRRNGVIVKSMTEQTARRADRKRQGQYAQSVDPPEATSPLPRQRTTQNRRARRGSSPTSRWIHRGRALVRRRFVPSYLPGPGNSAVLLCVRTQESVSGQTRRSRIAWVNLNRPATVSPMP